TDKPYPSSADRTGSPRPDGPPRALIPVQTTTSPHRFPRVCAGVNPLVCDICPRYGRQWYAGGFAAVAGHDGPERGLQPRPHQVGERPARSARTSTARVTPAWGGPLSTR